MASKKQPAKAGRPSLLVDPARKAILDAIRIGVPYKDAAEVGGIRYDTFCGWRAQGKKDEAEGKVSAFSLFWQDSKKAFADFIESNVKNIAKAGKRQWQASAWLLERRRPDDFSSDRKERARDRKLLEEVKALLERAEAERLAGRIPEPQTTQPIPETTVGDGNGQPS